MAAQVLAPAKAQPKILIATVAVSLALLYLVGLDQGHLLSLIQGSVAFDQNLIHELVHDVRHAAALPCH